MEFNEYLRELRLNNNLTMHQLASDSGVSQIYLTQIDIGTRGVPSIELLKKLCDPLKVSLFDLMQAAGYIESADKKQHEAATTDTYEINNLTKEEKEYLEKQLRTFRNYNVWVKRINNEVTPYPEVSLPEV